MDGDLSFIFKRGKKVHGMLDFVLHPCYPDTSGIPVGHEAKEGDRVGLQAEDPIDGDLPPDVRSRCVRKVGSMIDAPCVTVNEFGFCSPHCSVQTALQNLVMTLL